MCPRQSVAHSCFPCCKPWLAWASKRQCPREALFIVVKVVQVVFLSCPGEALYQLLSICPGEALLVSSRSALTILRTTAGGCARKEAEMCIIVKTTSFWPSLRRKMIILYRIRTDKERKQIWNRESSYQIVSRAISRCVSPSVSTMASSSSATPVLIASAGARWPTSPPCARQR